MGPLLFVLLLVVPIAELVVIVQVGERIGVLPTIALLIAVSIAGAWLLKQQGLATWKRLQQTLQRGEMPAREVTDGALILLGGALLLTPGFLTDVVGLVLLLPPTRASIKGVSRRFLGRWARRRFGTQRTVYDARVIRSDRREAGSNAPPSETHPSRGDLPPGEAGSRDRR